MKLIALALIAAVNATDPVAQPVGTACTKGGTTDCGPEDSMCCGVMSQGKILDMTDPSNPAPTSTAAPNIIVCNKKPDADDIPK